MAYYLTTSEQTLGPLIHLLVKSPQEISTAVYTPQQDQSSPGYIHREGQVLPSHSVFGRH